MFHGNIPWSNRLGGNSWLNPCYHVGGRAQIHKSVNWAIIGSGPGLLPFKLRDKIRPKNEVLLVRWYFILEKYLKCLQNVFTWSQYDKMENNHHWFRTWFVAFPAPRHNPIQEWSIVGWVIFHIRKILNVCKMFSPGRNTTKWTITIPNCWHVMPDSDYGLVCFRYWTWSEGVMVTTSKWFVIQHRDVPGAQLEGCPRRTTNHESSLNQASSLTGLNNKSDLTKRHPPVQEIPTRRQHSHKIVPFSC